MNAYSSYTAQPLLWGARIPTHWGILPLYAIAHKKSICNCDDMPLLSVYLDAGVVNFSDRSEKRTNATSADLGKYQRVDIGDLVLNNQQAWRGSVGVSFTSGIVSPAYIVLSLNDKLKSKYANYLFRSRIMVDQFLTRSKGVGSIQRNLYWSSLKRSIVPIPPILEQEQIAHFLDWKVSEINRLINIKRKELSEIEALKQAVISDAVIHGLNSDVPMKYSGIEWLGNIPNHWNLIKLRQILHPFSLKGRPDLPLLSVVREKGVILRDITSKESNHNFIPDDLSNYKVVKKNQFCINKMKAWQGSYGISNYTGIVSPAYFVFYVDFPNLDYFHFAIRSKVYSNFFAQASDGIRVGQWDLQIDKMKEIPFIVPPEEEQMSIVAYAKDRLESIEAASAQLTEEIELLEELKTKLISDVVTGRINVLAVQVPDFEYTSEVIDGDTTVEEE